MQSYHKIAIFLMVISISFNGFSQEIELKDQIVEAKASAENSKVPVHEKKTFQDSDQKIYWQVSIPAFINISPTSEDEGYNMKTVKTNSMQKHAEPMYFDGHGIHYIRHFDYEHSIPEQEVAFEVYVDGIAPVTKLKLDGAPKYSRSGIVYYGKGLSSTLITSDEMSGLDKVYHSTNGSEYVTYANIINYNEEKAYTYKYYAVDRVGNVEQPHESAFTVDLSAPTTNHSSAGDQLDNILSPRVSFTLNTSDNMSGVKKTSWNFDNKGNSTYTQKLYIGYLNDGEHTLNYTSVDNVNNTEEIKTYSFYLDKIAPEVSSKIEGDMYEKGGKTYISERSKLSLSAIDNKAGVDKIFYSIDGKTQLEYSEAFLLNTPQGLHNVKYRGIDKVKNLGSFKTDANLGNLYLDKTAPTVNHSYSGPQFFTRDTMFITSESKVHLKASDYQSGVQKIGYNLDKGNEIVFNDPFNVSNNGTHNVDYYALDQVNNKSNKDFFFIIDNDGPEIFHHFSMDQIGTANMDDGTGAIPIYAPHNVLYLAATDKAVGTDKIYYSLDEGSEKLYTSPIKNLKKGLRTLTIRSTDKLGNETTSETINFMIK